MHRFKSLSLMILSCSALAACGSTEPVVAKAPTVSILTPAQVTLLEEGPKPNALYDTVDGEIIAEVSADGKVVKFL